MNPQEDPQDDSEIGPLVPDDKRVWTSTDIRFLIAGAIGTCGLVVGTYYWSALLAALEADTSLRWSVWDTVRIATATTLAESVGLLVAGPVADHLPGGCLLCFEAVVVCISMVVVSLSSGPLLATSIITAVCFFKGLMWPTIGSVLAANLHKAKQDVAFLVTAMGSRFADVVGALLLGLLMQGFGCSWRQAVLILTICIIGLFISAYLVKPLRQLVEPQDFNAYSLSGQLLKGQRLLLSLDGWLALLVLAGTYSVWAFYGYITVLLAELYHISPGQAAGYSACFPAGSGLGLVTACLASCLLGVRFGRVAHLIQVTMGVCAMALLAINPDMALPKALCLHATVGFGFVVPCYLPYFIFAASSNRNERAFRLGVLDGLSCFLGVLMNYFYGRIRAAGTVQAAPKLMAMSMCGLLMSLVAMSIMYWRADARDTAERDTRAEDTD
mmetsp:Transcript_99992/g.214213  ORF Transcript_99992/g.214213 Transcript_99992/m.214213 type:complete len:442 (-) Transcript_99992:51-1376(-)|eukprot:CAMPEP_0180451460 /NCGR_PEP_ID=MMETSP1036_2-20121128/18754_1 /TAXON_ID=632150 /ORGANISM="Azadinium spinosum, Strain 3D9" /LENGTH=441 /DNA_ID=CAMNT_0022457909 /DNA_START=26 /DNA_END=1351 /DNA_ORIENTATION=+